VVGGSVVGGGWVVDGGRVVGAAWGVGVGSDVGGWDAGAVTRGAPDDDGGASGVEDAAGVPLPGPAAGVDPMAGAVDGVPAATPVGDVGAPGAVDVACGPEAGNEGAVAAGAAADAADGEAAGVPCGEPGAFDTACSAAWAACRTAGLVKPTVATAARTTATVVIPIEKAAATLVRRFVAA